VEDEEQAALIPVKQRMDRQYSMLSIRADLKRRTCRFLEPNVPIEMSGYLEWLKKELIAEHRDGGTQLLQGRKQRTLYESCASSRAGPRDCSS
jgi:hypothetical protein